MFVLGSDQDNFQHHDVSRRLYKQITHKKTSTKLPNLRIYYSCDFVLLEILENLDGARCKQVNKLR